MVATIQRVGRKDQGDLAMFDGRLEPKACMEWLEALENHFEADEIPANQRVKVAKAKLKGPALSWWNFL